MCLKFSTNSLFPQQTFAKGTIFSNVISVTILRFLVQRDTTQISTRSFHVKTLTFSMATRMYPMETRAVYWSLHSNNSVSCSDLLSSTRSLKRYSAALTRRLETMKVAHSVFHVLNFNLKLLELYEKTHNIIDNNGKHN